MKTTDELLKILEKSKNIDCYLENNSDSIIDIELRDYLENIMLERNISIPELIKRSNLASVYVYKILAGERMPGRDKLLCIAIGMQMSLQEIQMALRIAGHSLLYPKTKRDSIIIFAVNHNANLAECNETLYELGENILE